MMMIVIVVIKGIYIAPITYAAQRRMVMDDNGDGGDDSDVDDDYDSFDNNSEDECSDYDDGSNVDYVYGGF